MKPIRVALIQGGRSGEHEISLRSGHAVAEALEAAGYEVVSYFIDKAGHWQPAPILPEPGANPGIDVVFPVLHGTFGEDGTIQGLFEMADLPYVGGGVFASSASMDKHHFKRLCSDSGLPVVEYEIIRSGRFTQRAGAGRLHRWRRSPLRLSALRQALQSRQLGRHRQGARPRRA